MADTEENFALKDVQAQVTSEGGTVVATEEQLPTALKEVEVVEGTVSELPGWEKIPVSKDGWKMVHDAIRLDMTDFLSTLGKLEEHIMADNQKDWMGRNLKVWIGNFYKNVHEHHDHEEDIFFPEMSKKVTVPEKMSADHKTLIQALDENKAATVALGDELIKGASKESLIQQTQNLRESFTRLQTIMKEHLAEEEDIGIPLFRSHFTPAESKKIEAKILKHMKPIDLGWFLRPVESDEEKTEWMRDFAKMPGFVRKFIMFPIAKKGGKYDQKFTFLLDSIVAGKEISTPKPACTIS